MGWHSADFSGDGWKDDFEARYPEDNVNTARLKALAEWLVSTDTDQATDEELAEAVTYEGVEYTTDSVEYRRAKFSAELADHFVEDAVIFYYLFTELFLSIDQREKNAFPTYLTDVGKWIVLFYDADSSCGTDNKGNLGFDYYLEDIDYTEGGDPIYNGQNSVLWKNIRATRFDKIAAMYKEMRTNGSISYEKVIEKFENHQSKWPEAIFNEDMYTKCIEPLLDKIKPDKSYLPMLQGKKEQWMKWWLYNRFRYIDSKYETGTSTTNQVMFRARKKANVFLKSYVNMYGRVYYNAAVAEQRMLDRNREYEFIWDASGGEDAVIGINDADMLTSLGDLSPHMVDYIQAANATHITELKVGDDADDYKNPYTKSLSLGNNILLRKLDARNCIALEEAVNISGCTNIEEVYFDGSKITGLILPNGGILKTLHLPETVANLTLLNQTALTEFVMPSYANVTTLRLENNASIIDPLAILDQIAANSRVRIIGFDAEMTNAELMAFIAKLNTMRGLDENGNTIQGKDGNHAGCAQISGHIHVDTLTSAEQYNINTLYPSITITADTLILYTVRFYNGSTLLQTVENVSYNSSVEYEGETPIKDGETDWSRWSFDGWNPEPTAITGDTDYYAQYKFTGSNARELVQRTIESDYVNDRVTTVGQYAFMHSKKLTSVNFPEVTTIGTGSFQNCSGLTSVNFPKLTSIPQHGFAGCGALSSVVFPSVASIVGNFALYSDQALVTADFPSLTAINGTQTFYYTRLSTLILRNTDRVCVLGNPSQFNGNSTIASGTGHIYVPRALLSDDDETMDYRRATNWSTYADQFRALEDYTVDGTVTGELDETKI